MRRFLVDFIKDHEEFCGKTHEMFKAKKDYLWERFAIGQLFAKVCKTWYSKGLVMENDPSPACKRNDSETELDLG